MQHSRDGRHRRLDKFEQVLHCTPISDIASLAIDLRTACAEFSDNRLRLLGRSTAPADQHKVASAALDEPFGCRQSEAAEAAGYHVGAGRADSERRVMWTHGIGLRRLHYDFADVTGAFHQLERFSQITSAENAVRQWRKHAAFEAPHELRIDLAGDTVLSAINCARSTPKYLMLLRKGRKPIWVLLT